MWFSVIVFLIMTLLVGLHASIRVGNKVRNYYVAGNIIPAWVITFSLVGQAIDIASTQTHAELSLTHGFWAGAILPIGIGCSLLFIGLFVAERIHKLKLLTLVDYYLIRYDKRVELLAGVICIFSFIFLLASNLAGVGMLLNFMLGISAYQGVLVVALVVLICTIAGGLFAVIWNDVLHVGVMFVGVVAMGLWMMVQLDWVVAVETIEREFSWDPLFKSESKPLQTWAPLIALALGDIVALDFMERVFAAKTPKQARKSCLLAGIITILAGVLIGTIALLVHAFIENDASLSFLEFVKTYLPPGISMMVFMTFIAACVSTSDGALMACSKVLSKNILKTNFHNLINQDNLLLVSRLSAIPLMMVASCIAIVHSAPGNLLVIAFEVVLSGCFVPLLFGLYWSKSDAIAAFWSMLLASILRLVLFFYIPDKWQGLDTLIPPVVCALIFVSISLKRSSNKQSHLDHLTTGKSNKDLGDIHA